MPIRLKGIWVKKEIWANDKITIKERLVYSLLSNTPKYGNFVNLSSRLISDYLCFGINGIVNTLKSLESKRYIKLIKQNKTKEQIGFIVSMFGEKCVWCDRLSLSLHEHHFPIQKKDGGAETVKICPNCHADYHCSMFYHNIEVL